MKNGFLLAAVLLVLSGLTATAQIPRTLQIAVTNGTATVASQNSPGAFFGELETTTNLSPPIVWSGTFSPLFMTGMSSDVPATNAQTFFRLAQRWPVFEFAIFYNINMEIDPGNITPINGPVFSNAGIWAGSSSLIFSSTVSAVGQVNTSSIDPFATEKVDNGTPAGNFTLSGQPTSGVGALNLPGFGTTNAEAMLNIPPPSYAMGTAAAYSTNGLAYLANAVDLVISNSFIGTNFGSLAPKGTNISIYFQDAANTPYLQKLTPDFYILKTPAKTGLYTNYVSPNLSDTNRCYTNVQYAGWSFVTNVAFYDYRESKTVQAVQIDVSKFNIWVTNQFATNGGGLYNLFCDFDKGHTIDSIWIYNSVPFTSTTLPSVRCVNGTTLPLFSGLTIVTPFPLYIWGNYNVSNGVPLVPSRYPAALMGDAITILSSNWSDNYSLANTNVNSTTLAARPATNTTINAAMLEGIVPTVKTINGNYSGGVENFARLLESWTGSTNIYNGSVVVMFSSIYATNYWQTGGNYYTVPTRQWAFDTNFLQQSKLPPLTPQVVNFATP
jgi:hypothetical protein